MNKDLEIIRKHYGEKMMHICRSLFSTLLETDGLLSKLMLDNFAPSKFLYDDIMEYQQYENFKNYIYSKVYVQKNKIIINKTPKEMLSDAGYDLYECKTEKDIQFFKKYYAKGEELCTFNGGRLKRCYVFFAVKKNVDEIKRKDFKTPIRQDEYGTSVISIQFTRGSINTLSIKNRYNHRVNNPDATFSNNLENIISGLTESFEREYNLNINQNENNDFELSGYVKANDGRYYKYNYEINNIYYCPDNIIIDNFEVIKDYSEKEKYIVLDYFILDLVNKTIKLYDKKIEDCFTDGIKNIQKINVIKNKETGNKEIEIITDIQNRIIIEANKQSQIVGYKNNELTEIEDNFLFHNEGLTDLIMSNLEQVGNRFLASNNSLIRISLPKLVQVGDSFLYLNNSLTEINLPNLEQVRDCFLHHNNSLIQINFPELIQVGNYFLTLNKSLIEINLPKLEQAGDRFLASNNSLIEINFPRLKQIGNRFLASNKGLIKISMPNLQQVGDDFLYHNNSLIQTSFPELKKIGYCFLYNNNSLIQINFPKLIQVGNYFLSSNQSLIEINLPNLEQVGDDFLYHNNRLIKISFPELIQVGNYFLSSNQSLIEINLPKLEQVGDSFLASNNNLIEINFQRLKKVGDKFLYSNESLTKINLPKLEQVGVYFLTPNNSLHSLYGKKITGINKIKLSLSRLKNNIINFLSKEKSSSEIKQQNDNVKN